MTARTEVLLTGRGLLESPRWHEGTLYVSDWSAGEVFALRDGAAEVVARVDSLPLCFDFLPDGRMVLVDSAHGRLLDRYGNTVAELGPGNWNDIAVDRSGHVFVNRVEFDGTPGAVHLAAGGQVADGLAFPNGMAVLAGTLIVAESHAQRLTAFDIGADGSLANRRVWAEVDGSAPDGICVDGDTVWYADVPNTCCVRVAEGGRVLDRVDLDRGGFACAIGAGTLYTVAAEFLGMAELVTPGSGQVLATPLADR